MGTPLDFFFLHEDTNSEATVTPLPGLSRIAILNAVEQSLSRLQTSYIDVLHVHRFDCDTPIEETMSTLHGLVACGKVRYLAASSMWAFELAQMQCVAEIRGWTKFIAMQNHYSLLYREEEREMIKYCKRSGVGLLAVSLTASLGPSRVSTFRVVLYCTCPD